ncbi:MAG: UvrD-helicase domain-containing protein, partial [Solirubrobacteraceae bacterium]
MSRLLSDRHRGFHMQEATDVLMATISNTQKQLALDYEQQPAHVDVPERRLTDEQERAVASRQASLLLAAGAGSGKTSVLVERFVRAVREDGV